MYTLKQIGKIDNMYDYVILLNETNIGKLCITLNTNDIFIRHIGIEAPFRRCGHARQIVEYLLEGFKKDVSFCVATNSESAVKFWDKILREKKHEHIRGNIYKIYSL